MGECIALGQWEGFVWGLWYVRPAETGCGPVRPNWLDVNVSEVGHRRRFGVSSVKQLAETGGAKEEMVSG